MKRIIGSRDFTDGEPPYTFVSMIIKSCAFVLGGALLVWGLDSVVEYSRTVSENSPANLNSRARVTVDKEAPVHRKNHGKRGERSNSRPVTMDVPTN